MDNGEFIEVPIENNEIKPSININEILAPEPNEDKLTKSEIASRTLDRLAPYISPFISAEEINSAKDESSNRDETYLRERLAREMGDNLGYLGILAPEPADFDGKVFLALTQYDNTRVLEIAVELGLIIKQPNGRFMLPQKSKDLFFRLLI